MRVVTSTGPITGNITNYGGLGFTTGKFTPTGGATTVFITNSVISPPPTTTSAFSEGKWTSSGIKIAGTFVRGAATLYAQANFGLPPVPYVGLPATAVGASSDPDYFTPTTNLDLTLQVYPENVNLSTSEAENGAENGDGLRKRHCQEYLHRKAPLFGLSTQLPVRQWLVWNVLNAGIWNAASIATLL
jgi:hypothetical protein